MATTKKQTARGKAQDKRKTSKKTLSPTKANVKKWKKAPNRIDIKGIDTKNVKKVVPQNKIKTKAGTGGWVVSSDVKRSLDDSDIKSLKKAYKFYVEQFYNSADKVQKIGLWLSYNKYRKDETKWKASYKKQSAMEQKTLKDALKYKKMVDGALLKPPNHKDVMKDINDMIKLIS